MEAQASGRPVIAYGKGGALETVVEGKTGVFFEEQTVKSLKEAVDKFKKINFDKQEIRKHALNLMKKFLKIKLDKFINGIV